MKWHYVVIRADLPLKHQGPQAIHAGYEAGSTFGTPGWNGCLVTLEVPDEQTLLTLSKRLAKADIRHIVWRDSFFKHQACSLGTEPLTAEQGDAFKGLPLWTPHK